MRPHGVFRTTLAAGLVSAALLVSAGATQQRVSISGSAPASVKAGRKLMAKVKFSVPSGFHIYAPDYKSPDGTGVPVSFSLQGAPAGYRVLSPSSRSGLLSGVVTMTVPIATPAGAKKGAVKLNLVVNYQQCNDRICLPPTNSTVHLKSSIK